jgi:hypothetical protein
VWVILVSELFLEVLIRPKGYSDLMESDRAFAPSTARHISTFHIVFEGIALVTFIPELWSLIDTDDSYTQGALYSRLRASMDAVLGEDARTVTFGRFLMGLTALRLFGVVRHWKQMWINNTFQASDQEGIDRNQLPAATRISSADSIGSVPTIQKSVQKVRERRKRKSDVRFGNVYNGMSLNIRLTFVSTFFAIRMI